MNPLSLSECREAIRRFAWARDREGLRSVQLPIDRELEQAVLMNNIEAAQIALRSGACADVTEEEHFYRATAWAIHNDNAEIVALLLENGAEANAEDQDGNSLLSEAVSGDSGGNPEIVRSLLEAGASVKAPDACGFLPHFWAAIRNNVETLELLRLAGADLNWQDEEGNDASMQAREAGATKALAYLLTHGLVKE